MADVQVMWISTGAPPYPPVGQAAEITAPWPEDLPLPIKGELIELPDRLVLEVIGRAFLVGLRGERPVLALHCRAVEGAPRG